MRSEKGLPYLFFKHNFCVLRFGNNISSSDWGHIPSTSKFINMVQFFLLPFGVVVADITSNATEQKVIPWALKGKNEW